MLPVALIASLIGGIAPTIAQGLMIKGTIADKAMGILNGFVKKLNRPENEELEYSLRKLEFEQIMMLQRLDAEFKLEMERNKFELDKLVVTGQLDLIKADSRSLSWARKWWRPFIAWSCGIGLSLYICILPLIQLLLAGLKAGGVISEVFYNEFVNSFPLIQMDVVLALIVPLLGLGAYRSFEKMKRVDPQE